VAWFVVERSNRGEDEADGTIRLERVSEGEDARTHELNFEKSLGMFIDRCVRL
jgi:hypothetical protein